MKLFSLKTIAIGSILSLAGAALPAFAVENLHVRVPFSFMVGGTKMPAGEYTISQSENGMMTLSSQKASAMVLTVPSDYSKNNATGLSFTSADQNPVLTTVQVGGAISREIPQRSADRKANLVSSR